MSDPFGIRVVRSPHVPDGQAYVMGEFEKPPGWPKMTEQERLAYAVAHGAVVVVKNLARARWFADHCSCPSHDGDVCPFEQNEHNDQPPSPPPVTACPAAHFANEPCPNIYCWAKWPEAIG